MRLLGAGLLMAIAASAQADPPALHSLPRDTPVTLMVLREVSSRDSAVGTRFMLRTIAPVVQNGVVLVPKGTLAWGEVTAVEASGRAGRAGRLSARLLYLELDGRQFRLDGETGVQPRDTTRDVAMAVVGTGPIALLARGNSARIKAGETMIGFLADDVAFDGPAR